MMLTRARGVLLAIQVRIGLVQQSRCPGMTRCRIIMSPY